MEKKCQEGESSIWILNEPAAIKCLKPKNPKNPWNLRLKKTKIMGAFIWRIVFGHRWTQMTRISGRGEKMEGSWTDWISVFISVIRCFIPFRIQRKREESGRGREIETGMDLPQKTEFTYRKKVSRKVRKEKFRHDELDRQDRKKRYPYQNTLFSVLSRPKKFFF